MAAGLFVAGCQSGRPGDAPAGEVAGSRYLYVWAGDADKQQSDFLAVVDVDPRSPTYAEIVTTVPVGESGTMAHHTEYEMPADGVLWANGFTAGRTFRFDVRDPLEPRLAGAFGDRGPFSHPHSYARLPGGNVLAAFQHRVGDAGATGGLVELDSAGAVVRYGHGATAVDSTARPYSLTVVPALDRAISTGTDMHLKVRTRSIQIWRLSDLTLLHTLLLPPGPRGDENWLPAEARVLADGRTVLVNTFTCGLYRLRGLDGDAPSAEWVSSTPWAQGQGYCAVPVVAGRFWVQTSGPERAVFTLEVPDSGPAREVSRLTLGPNEAPHWIGREPGGGRLVISGYRALEPWVLLAAIDTATGRLSLDSTFKAPGAERVGVYFGRDEWPHGANGPAVPHGAVFARPAARARALPTAGPRETLVPVGKTPLFVREVGRGRPVLVLHGGPDFDHGYLLPDLDRLSDSFRLIYYDQRGRGQSAEGVEPTDVTLESEVADLDRLRRHHRIDRLIVLGHSWGTVLALEYALRHPTAVSHLVLMNPAPASARDYGVLRESYIKQLGPDLKRQQAIMATAEYQRGDPETVTARYRFHFKHALARPEDYEKLMETMRAGFLKQGASGVVMARKVEDRLMADTWSLEGYDLVPQLRTLDVPALVITGDRDFIPTAIAAHVATAMPKARLVVLKDCGHFAYMECPRDVRDAVTGFFRSR